MALFKFLDYTRPGKGVDKDEAPMPPLKQFFVVLGRRFSKIFLLNFMYLIFALPLTYGLIFALSPLVVMFQYSMDLLGLYLFGIILFLATIGFAPINLPMAYILRNFSRRQHAYIGQDFFGQLRANFKKSIIVMIIDILVTVIFIVDFMFMDRVILDPYVLTFIKVTVSTVCVLYTIMHFYLYQIMITFDMKLSEMYKNAIILTFAKLPMNLLICLIMFSVTVVFLLYPYLFIFGVSFLAYIPNYYAQLVILRYMEA